MGPGVFPRPTRAGGIGPADGAPSTHLAGVLRPGIHHFVTIGEFAYIAGYSRVHHDVPPFVVR